MLSLTEEVEVISKILLTMSQLISKAFIGGNTITAKGRAYNSLGWDPTSDISNNDILVQVILNSVSNLLVANVDAIII